MCLKAAHISGSIKRALQVKGTWGMCYTMAYLSAHYGALLDIGWDSGWEPRSSATRKPLNVLAQPWASFSLSHILYIRKRGWRAF